MPKSTENGAMAPEKKPEIAVESIQETEVDLESAVTEKVSSLESFSNRAIEDGPKQIDGANGSVGLAPEEFEALKKQFGISEKIGNIADKIKNLLVEARAKLQGVLEGKESVENSERSADEQAEKEVSTEKSEESEKEKVRHCENCGRSISASDARFCNTCGHKLGVEVFNPQGELENIKFAPKDQRKEKMANFKEQLLGQKMGIMKITNTLFEMIKNNPQVTPEELLASVAEMEDENKLIPMQRQAVRKAVELYQQKKDKIQGLLRESFDGEKKNFDGKKIFNSVFQFEPKGAVQINVMGSMIQFKVDNMDDYSRINSGAFLEGRGANDNERNAAMQSGGCKLRNVANPELKGSVIVENSFVLGGIDKNKGASQEILVHEAQHAFNDIIREAFNPEQFEFDKKRSKIDVQLNKSFLENDDINARMDRSEMTEKEYQSKMAENEKRTKQLDEDQGDLYGRQRNNSAYELEIKDEISAYFADGRSPDGIKQTLLGGNTIYRYGFAHTPKEGKDPNEMSDQYKKIVERGVDAFQSLVDGGFSKEEAQAMLFSEPLRHWGRVVDRVKKAKEATQKEALSDFVGSLKK